MSNEEKENVFETAVNDYVANVLPRIEVEVRRAFLAGVQFGIDQAKQVYGPE
jgi:hypothetical protein